MIEFGGIYYYLDLAALESMVYFKQKPNDFHTSFETTTKTLSDGSIEKTVIESSLPKLKEMDGMKYDILRNCVEVILDTDDQGDSALGAEKALEAMPLSYKMAFNTLYNYGIIKEQE